MTFALARRSERVTNGRCSSPSVPNQRNSFGAPTIPTHRLTNRPQPPSGFVPQVFQDGREATRRSPGRDAAKLDEDAVRAACEGGDLAHTGIT